ncbi:hypothetical protein GYB22_04280 [bacterium]|nr:hypothetical protein [bacterium]
MRKIVMAGLILFFLASCKTKEPDALLKAWKVNDIEMPGYEQVKIVNLIQAGIYYEFKSNNEYSSIIAGQKGKGSYSFKKDDMTLLMVDNSGEKEEVLITELTEKQMIWRKGESTMTFVPLVKED